MAAPETLTEGTQAHLYTYLAVRQDGLELYGFTTREDRRFFELSLSVSGVGPKTALSLLRRASRESLEGAIAKRDVEYLTRVVGLGKKAAEKLIVELSEKLMTDEIAHDDGDSEVFDMLVALGYTEREARKAIGAVPSTVLGKEARFRAALGKKG
jgi:Holliday junction DNA helicase RuvA